MRRLFKVLSVIVGVIVLEQIFETALMMWAFKSRNPRVIGWLTWYHKHVTNPVWVRFFAGRSTNSALLHHVGRKSGKAFVTPLTAHKSEDTIIIPMPYGTETDWLRNLQAAGQGVVELDHLSYSVDEPEVVPVDEVMALLSPMVARIVQLHETEKALRLRVAGPAERLSA
ncbi:MAG: nitroreductase family deazaflavin-dependent oxidoreductase [Acidimicrobiia bacterium]